MGKRTDWLFVGVILVGVLGVGVGLASLKFLDDTSQKTVVLAGGFGVSLVSLFISGLRWLWDARRLPAPRPVDTLADSLAQVVGGQWRKAAAERALLTPAPIPVRWSLSELEVTGTVEAAVSSGDGASGFLPLPGQTRITEEQLRAGGGRAELFAVYAGIASGRMVVLGAPGAGKSTAAVLLVLDALTHREGVDAGRAGVPVPVLFTVHGWDPQTCSVQDWLSARLAAEYPLFQHRGGHAEAAALVAAGSVALVLDGLDEMDPAARPAALQALSDVAFRVVVLTRDQEMVQAARSAWLRGAVAIQLHNVAGADGAGYLQRARTGPAPAGWTPLLTHLRERSDSVLTHALSTPLALTLIRDTYRAGDDVGELLDSTRFTTTDLIEQHLIARVLPDAYAVRPGRPAPRYSLSKAHQALAFIARQMNNDHTRDLAWWRIPRWVPTRSRVLATGLVATLGSGLAFALGDALGGSIGGNPLTWLSYGAAAWLLARLCAGRPMGRIVVQFSGGNPQRFRAMNWRAFRARPVLVAGLVTGVIPVFTADIGIGDTQVDGLMNSLVPRLGIGLLAGLVAWLVVGLVIGLIDGGPSEASTLDPRASVRHDRMFWLVCSLLLGLLFGPVIWLSMLLPSGQVHGPLPVLLRVLPPLLVFGLAIWLEISLASQTTLAWLQLWLSRRIPTVALMPFLEDAQARGVLRTVGATYQFRHATLQDQLAGQTTANPATSSAALLP